MYWASYICPVGIVYCYAVLHAILYYCIFYVCKVLVTGELCTSDKAYTNISIVCKKC